jgi:hypothetical protein
MNTSPALLSHIDRVEDHIRKARQSWTAASGPDCAECLRQLQEAIAGMHQAQAAAASGSSAAEAKARLRRLQQELNLLSRLVDASIAFYRGLALHSGMEEAIPSSARG